MAGKKVDLKVLAAKLQEEVEGPYSKYSGYKDPDLHGFCSKCGDYYDDHEKWNSKGLTECCSVPLHIGSKVSIKKSTHFACQDHKDGMVLEGDTYTVEVFSCWKEPVDAYGQGSTKWKYEKKRLIKAGYKRQLRDQERQAEVNRLLRNLKEKSTMVPQPGAPNETTSSQT